MWASSSCSTLIACLSAATLERERNVGIRACVMVDVEAMLRCERDEDRSGVDCVGTAGAGVVSDGTEVG